MSTNICFICNLVITSRQHALSCQKCGRRTHRASCLPPVSSQQYTQLRLSWICTECLNSGDDWPASDLPFHDTELSFGTSFIESPDPSSKTNSPSPFYL